MIRQRIKKRYYKTLGTSVINSSSASRGKKTGFNLMIVHFISTESCLIYDVRNNYYKLDFILCLIEHLAGINVLMVAIVSKVLDAHFGF